MVRDKVIRARGFMVDFSIILGLTPDGKDVARHIKKRKVDYLKEDAVKLSKQSSDYIEKVVVETVKEIGAQISPTLNDSHDQTHLIGFVADLTGDASTKSLHFLVHDYKVSTEAIVDAFVTAIGTGQKDRVMNLLKAFPELLFEKMADSKCVYDHFSEAHWIELLKAKVINTKFFKMLTKEQVMIIFRKIPVYEPLLNSKSLIRLIVQRNDIRNDLLKYFDRLVRDKDSKASFIMRLASMPLTSKDSDGNWRLLKYSQAFSFDLELSDTFAALSENPEASFLIELFSTVEIPQTLESYQFHYQIGRMLETIKGVRRKILDHISDPVKRKERSEIFDYCLEVYHKHKENEDD